MARKGETVQQFDDLGVVRSFWIVKELEDNFRKIFSSSKSNFCNIIEAEAERYRKNVFVRCIIVEDV